MKRSQSVPSTSERATICNAAIHPSVRPSSWAIAVSVRPRPIRSFRNSFASSGVNLNASLISTISLTNNATRSSEVTGSGDSSAGISSSPKRGSTSRSATTQGAVPDKSDGIAVLFSLSIDSHATGPPYRCTQSATAVVFPKPAGAETSTVSPYPERSICPHRRDRDTKRDPLRSGA